MRVLDAKRNVQLSVGNQRGARLPAPRFLV
jgi:hypothetical protein